MSRLKPQAPRALIPVPQALNQIPQVLRQTASLRQAASFPA
jgi:hypothetical protein